MKDTLGRQIDVDDLRDGELHQRQKDALDGLDHPRIFHRRLADDGGRVDGIPAVRDAGDVEDGVFVFHGVEAGLVAEGTFRAQFA